ncbi:MULTISPECIES: hypothetical protein [unclassified Xanthobacter]|uniref:hypothetical protein n=1 Tax=unclassified Xanthobacter TaxID=2623496 RepID=UPI001F2FE679|nr:MULTISPECIES: hypothetical protein [unclassified Xanthobacter]
MNAHTPIDINDPYGRGLLKEVLAQLERTSARLDRLEQKARPKETPDLLPKLERSLMQALEEAHAKLPEPHFVSEKTGNNATSLYVLQDAMGFVVPVSRWADMCRRLEALPSFYGSDRFKGRKRSGWPTPCFDLAEVEQALLLMWPGRKKDHSDSKAHDIIRKFKSKWGVK